MALKLLLSVLMYEALHVIRELTNDNKALGSYRP
jgi:hypothetical protein